MRQGPNWYTFIFISNMLSRYIAQSSKSSDYHVDVSTVMRLFRPRCRLDSVPFLFSWNLAAFGLPAKRARASSRRDRKVDEADAFERGKHRAHSD